MTRIPDTLSQDQDKFRSVLEAALAHALQVIDGLPLRPVAAGASPPLIDMVVDEGIGAHAALAAFEARFAHGMSGSAGPRYFGFITGGVTPAACLGDWLASVYDQNAMGSTESNAAALELETIARLRHVIGLPDSFYGVFVSGATMANVTGLATARQWLGAQHGIDIGEAGIATLGEVRVFSGSPHSSVLKALALLGLGRQSLCPVPTLPDREAIDVDALAAQLAQARGPSIVVANAGTVNTCDFDDLEAVLALKQRFDFWLHVDAAFAGIAAASDAFRPLLDGWEQADSITVDCHKWLNVPYDSAVALTPHLALQAQVFRNQASYLRGDIDAGNFLHLTPENSRRLRALPAWFTLTAYGRASYAAIVERNCAQARWLGEQIAASAHVRLLAPVRLNGFCFTVQDGEGAAAESLRERINATGEVFMTPTVLFGVPAIRGAISNATTTESDMARVWQAIQSALQD